MAHCWSHWRRRFVQFGQDTPSPICDEMIARIASLHAIEKEIRGRDPATRRAVRQKLSKPIVEALRPWLEACLQDLSSATPERPDTERSGHGGADALPHEAGGGAPTNSVRGKGPHGSVLSDDSDCCWVSSQ